ncbi:retrotransposon nucleocapsid related protein [Cyclospora cayetanensis]|uniref:Retrotransposon nucleocapsid related protein n=1 Tax=Cyclospora cayetanensis TaxID=88456 RepID=A0A1D3D0A1_9EIME|nr:retrotransposon nucleocapsid related protein [Cyclospora cayetanensis]
MSYHEILPFGELVHNTKIRSSTRCSAPALVYAGEPLSVPGLNFAFSCQLPPIEAEGFREQLASVSERMCKKLEKDYHEFMKRHSVMCFEYGDLVLVDQQALQDA